jgi:hypothetical protein
VWSTEIEINKKLEWMGRKRILERLGFVKIGGFMGKGKGVNRAESEREKKEKWVF